MGSEMCIRDRSTVACGRNHTIALSCAGGVYGWGSNARGQLGRRRTDSSQEDVVVRDLADFEGPSPAIGSLAPGAPGPSGLPPRRRGNVTLEETDSETDTEYDMW